MCPSRPSGPVCPEGSSAESLTCGVIAEPPFISEWGWGVRLDRGEEVSVLLRGRGGLPDLAVGSAVQFRVKWTGTNRLRERVGRVVGDFWYVHHSRLAGIIILFLASSPREGGRKAPWTLEALGVRPRNGRKAIAE